MTLTLAAIMVAASTFGAAYAADPPVAAPAAAPAAASNAEQGVTAKAGDPAPKKKEVPKKPVKSKPAEPVAAGAASPVQKPSGSGLEVPSARTRPPTAPTTMTGTRGIKKKSDAEINAEKSKTTVSPTPADKGDTPASKAKGN